jgi:pyruvate formate lyase activating enzyme
VRKTPTVDESGVIFDLQRFSVHDGPGIRSLVFINGCPLHCEWCSNPESHRFEPEILFDQAKCIGCRSCAPVCPTGAIWVEADTVGYDRSKCFACGRCTEACYPEARVLKGKAVTAEWVVAQVLKDEAFFANSGGGVTLGGGEPLAQPEFARAILRRCREKGLHTAVETCGHIPWFHIELALPWTNLFLFDLKHVNRVKHQARTRGDVGLILSNLARLAAAGPAVIVRIPIIPTFNDEPEEIAAIADQIAALRLREVHLLPYHRLGQGKYRLLGRDTLPMVVRNVGETQLNALRGTILKAGLKVMVSG